jgi:NitT/TauT family transport system substrate-binding protein
MSTTRIIRSGLVALLTAAVAFGATACGSGDGGGTPGAGGKRVKVTVGVQPAVPFVVVPLGVQQGFFRKQGLDVEVRTITTATTIPPALLAGQLQFADWSFASFATLAEKKLPLKIVGPGDIAGNTLKDDYTQLVTLKGSGITSVRQLRGKKIAVNSLASLSQAQTMAALKNAGVDPKSVEYIPIAYPDQNTALLSKRVDAVQSGEPFLTKFRQQGKVTALAALDAAVMRDLPVSTWMTSERFAKQRPETVAAFQRGLRESLAYAQAHPEAVRAFVPEFAGVDAATAREMILPRWTTEVDHARIQRVADAMRDYGIVKRSPVMRDYVLPFPAPRAAAGT